MGRQLSTSPKKALKKKDKKGGATEEKAWKYWGLGGALAVALAAVCYAGLTKSSRQCDVKLEIRKSTIPGAGLGLFLAADSPSVRRGSFVTTYGEQEVPQQQTAPGTPLEFYSLTIPNRPGYSRVGHPWRGRVPAAVPCGRPIGHMLNDAAAIHLPPGSAEGLGIERLFYLADAYKNASEARRNVAFGPGHHQWTMLANRDIYPGDELFYTYGVYFWMAAIFHHSQDPYLRLLIYQHRVKENPQSFPGDYIEIGAEQRPWLVKEGIEAPEDVCEFFAKEILGIETQVKAAAVADQYGVSWPGSYKELVTAMLKRVAAA